MVRPRSVGAEHACLAALNQLKLDKKLMELGFTGPQRAAAIGNIVARMINPGSELATSAWLAQDSGLGELIDFDYESLRLNRLYRASDQLLSLEKHLYQQEQSLFGFAETVTLYDLTNTFFEGRSCSNEVAKFGRSKEKRSDCRLVTLALVLDGSGFPKRSEIFQGNASEPGTLEHMLTDLNVRAGTTVIIDAGIASQENIDWLLANQFNYLAVSRQRRREFDHEKAKAVQSRSGDVIQVQRIVEAEEVFLYCQSPRRKEKEEAMQARVAENFESSLSKLAKGLAKKRCIKKYDKIMIRIGRLKERYSSAAQHYQLNVVTDKKTNKVTEITWKRKPINATQATHPGVYCLRTNLADWDEDKLWHTYTMLTDLEAVFRSLKSELGLRPIYHQTTDRVKGHLFITVLAYHLVHTLRMQLKAHGIHDSWETIRHRLSRQQRITVILKDRDGSTWHIRKATRPEPQEQLLFDALNLDHYPGRTLKSHAT